MGITLGMVIVALLMTVFVIIVLLFSCMLTMRMFAKACTLAEWKHLRF